MENNSVPEGMPVVGISAKAPDQKPETVKAPEAKAPDQEGTAPIEQPQFTPPPTKGEVYAPVYNPQIPQGLEPNTFYQQATDEIQTKQAVTDDTLRKDPLFLDAARVLAEWDDLDGREEMTNDDLGTYLLTKANRLNYNMTKAIGASIEFEDAPDEIKAALAYALNQYEDKEWSGEGAAGMFWGAAGDYINLFSAAATGGISVGARVLAGKSITGKILQKIMMHPKTMLAAEGAALGGGAMYVDEDLRRTVDKDKTDINYGSVALGAGLGMVAPGAVELGVKGVGKAVRAVGRGISDVMGAGEEAMAKAAGGGTPDGGFNTGESTQQFFNDVAAGKDPKFKPSQPHQMEIETTDPVTKDVAKEMDKHKGLFDEHIATSIPTFREIQVEKASAIVKTYPEGATMIDLGGSEGGFNKAITSVSGGKIKTINLDAADEMMKKHTASPVAGAKFEHGAFQQGWEGVPTYTPEAKVDVVHESMMFQFIDNERASKLDEIVAKYIKEDGILLTEEKFSLSSKDVYAANEKLKGDLHKSKYYTEEQQAMKTDEVLLGMEENQAAYDKYIGELKDRFEFVDTYWTSGNFRGIIATNNKAKFDQFKANLNPVEASGKYNAKINYEAGDVTEGVPAVEYTQAMDTARKNLGSKAALVDGMSEADAQKIIDDGGKLFLTTDGKAGAYVKADGYMGGLFKDPTADKGNAAKILQNMRVSGGGKFFDSFENNEGLYIKNGYTPVARMKFDEKYAPEGWQTNPELQGKPDNVFFVYSPDKKGKAGSGREFTDYDEAYEYAKNFKPGETVKTAADVIASVKDLNTKQATKQLQASLRDLDGAERAKVIEHLKASKPEKKPKEKSPKVEKIIQVQEDFNKQFYSKAENEFEALKDAGDLDGDMYQKLLDQGVKKAELEGIGIKPGMAYDEVSEKMRYRNDQISKVVYDEDSTGIPVERGEYDYDLDIDESANVSVGDSGYGARIRSNIDNEEIEIGMIYNDDQYETLSGTYVGDRDTMLTEWYEYEATSEMKDSAKNKLMQDGFDDPNEREIMDTVIEMEEEAGNYPWDNEYKNTVTYVDDYGDYHDSMEDAIDSVREKMYDDYENNADMNPTEIYEDYTVGGGGDYRMEVYQMEGFTSAKDSHTEPHLHESGLEADNVQVHARMKTRKDANGKKGTVIEEIQSQWEQDWRKQGGGRKMPTPEERKVAQAEVEKVLAEYKTYQDKHVKPNDAKFEKIASAQTKIRTEYADKAIPVKEDLRVKIRNLEEQRKGIDKSTDEGFETDYQLRVTIAKLEEKFDAAGGKYKEDPKYIKLSKEYDKARTESKNISEELRKISAKSKDANRVLDQTEPTLATPPIQDRTQYTKLAMLDNLINSVDTGDNYYGWINGHLQNGSRIKTTVGMSQAYDIEMPRIIEKAIGKKPYMAQFDDGLPVSGEKIYWDGETARGDLEYYDDLAETREWYWRVDLDEATKTKVRNSKIEKYGVGGVALVGANEATQSEEN